MAEILKVPKISETISEVTITSLLVKQDDSVSQGQIVAEFETDKANFDFESPWAGKILKVFAKAGQTLKVGESLAIVGENGEDISNLVQ
ncbi:MAG: hypothetical protein A2X47_00015 [Lentisphaerae bacterium GWF2_38_69]|nr:MAG: hypothetical protein A2X47_00015 [Lentisphaerae bacterium GWF2_38_69]HBG25816.1 hypothetical protein [Phycisphaerales bacterium]